jgi:hypothetical protein
LYSNEDLDEYGTDFAARVTALPVWAAQGARYLHVGTSVRWCGAADVPGFFARWAGLPFAEAAHRDQAAPCLEAGVIGGILGHGYGAGVVKFVADAGVLGPERAPGPSASRCRHARPRIRV